MSTAAGACIPLGLGNGLKQPLSNRCPNLPTMYIFEKETSIIDIFLKARCVLYLASFCSGPDESCSSWFWHRAKFLRTRPSGRVVDCGLFAISTSNSRGTELVRRMLELTKRLGCRLCDSKVEACMAAACGGTCLRGENLANTRSDQTH
jgi:hypothetical protein